MEIACALCAGGRIESTRSQSTWTGRMSPFSGSFATDCLSSYEGEKMKVYYAHCQAIYGTPQEARDVELLMALGWEVVNPAEHGPVAKEMKAKGIPSSKVMEYFVELALGCDVLVFRALPDGAVPAGILKEVHSFREAKKPVLELPSCLMRRELNVEQTREYLHEVGQR